MNAIRFEIAKTDAWYGKGTNIYVDGRNLIELAREVERHRLNPGGHLTSLARTLAYPPERYSRTSARRRTPETQPICSPVGTAAR